MYNEIVNLYITRGLHEFLRFTKSICTKLFDFEIQSFGIQIFYSILSMWLNCSEQSEN